MHIRSWLAFGLMFTQAWASAQTGGASSVLTLDDARAQRVRGKALKAEAEARYETERLACQNKLIAVSCLSAAKQRRTDELKAADTLEREGRKAEREAHRMEVEAKAVRREAEAPGREAKQQTDVERYREKGAQRAAERERSMALESARTEGRRNKLAAQQAVRQKKLEERRKENAKRAEKAPENARKRAAKERQYADRVKKIDERARQYAELLKRREAEEAARQAAASAR